MVEEMRQEGPQPDLFSPKERAELLARARRARAAGESGPLGVGVGECREVSRASLGAREAFGAVCDLPGWNRVLGARRAASNRIVRELVPARLGQPLSKRATVRELARQGDVSLGLESACKAMDCLDETVAERIRERSCAAAADLLAHPVTAVFYDTTTLHFDSEASDGFREKGSARTASTTASRCFSPFW